MANTYIVGNYAMPTTAAPVKVTSGTAIQTMLQIKPAVPISVVEWGFSCDGIAAALPGNVCLIDTGTVFGTVTASAAADVMPFNDPNAPANSAGASGVPLNLSTTATGYTCTSEGAVTATRTLDAQLISPMTQYVKQFPLGREPRVVAGNCLRVRATFAAAVNVLTYVIFET
jgi:hypothetical protein